MKQHQASTAQKKPSRDIPARERGGADNIEEAAWPAAVFFTGAPEKHVSRVQINEVGVRHD
jgi:hypothetical protein